MHRPVAGPGQVADGATLAAVLRTGLPDYLRLQGLPRYQRKILQAIQNCRTAALGGHRYQRAQCGREHFVPHACRNRHCPPCQGAQAIDWLERQSAALLPIPYFHLVFTLPHALNPLIRQNRRALFDLLFGAATQTLQEFGRQKLKAQIGITAVLHTWGQTLVDHYHLHGIVTGGGLALDDSGWNAARPYFLFPIKALSTMFGGKFRAGLRALYDQGSLEFHGQVAPMAREETFATLLQELQKQKWVVYAKRPFAGPEQVLAYLSRYTHRVAISNRRLYALDEVKVTFGYKDYADGHRRKTMTLTVTEFVRRFCLHLLPERFVKIRPYGLLSNRNRQERIARVRQALGVNPAPAGEPSPTAMTLTEASPRQRCPYCGAMALVWVEELPPLRRISQVMIADTS
jgi:Putative transposase/Transposase zinc-binding domain